MLVGLKDILKIAEADKTAVGMFNGTGFDSIRAVIGAAEELNRPVIIAHAEVHNVFNDISLVGPAMLAAARAAKVPVCVHLDHGVTAEMCYRALRLGFTGIMIDASALPYEENLALTRQITEAAHAMGADVEAELGRLATPEAGSAGEGAAPARPEDFYTVPAEAKSFCAETGVDALAIAFGTAHGFYKSQPKLDFGVVRDCADRPPARDARRQRREPRRLPPGDRRGHPQDQLLLLHVQGGLRGGRAVHRLGTHEVPPRRRVRRVRGHEGGRQEGHPRLLRRIRQFQQKTERAKMKDLKEAYKTIEADHFAPKMEISFITGDKREADHFAPKMEISFITGDKRETLSYEKVTWNIGGEEKGLRYGENPGQEAALYKLVNGNILLGDVETIQPGRYLASVPELLQSGKHPGKTNVTDTDNALNILRSPAP